MARPITKGIPAHYHHAPVAYTPFSAPPGSSMVLASDPWAYISSHLTGQEKKTKGDNRERFRRSVYYLSLAEAFYSSASTAVLPAKATLAYYGVLNLAKCFICASGKLLGDSIEHHGLSPSNTPNSDIRVSGRSKHHINIFHEFVVALGSSSPTKTDLSLNECIAHIPEIHEIASRLELLPDNRRHLLPIDITILTDKDEKWLFSQVSYQKKQDKRLKTERFLARKRETYFRSGVDDGEKVAFRCKRRKAFKWSNFERIFSNICSEYASFDIATLLTKDGYRYYCDLSNPVYHHLAYSFMLLFYLGTVSRYSPSKTQEILQGKLRPVIAEALSISPRQFLYQLTSQITSSVCVVPYSSV